MGIMQRFKGKVAFDGGNTVDATARTSAATAATAAAAAQTTANAALPQAGGAMTGVLTPWVRTTTQKGAIASPAAGMVVYDTTLGKLCVYTGSAWETVTSSA